MSWYIDATLKIAARQDPSVEAYLARCGVPEATISYVTTLPPELKRKVVGLLSRSPQTTVENLMEQIRTPVEMQKQPPVTPPMPVLDARFKSPQEKQQFFSRIPREYVQWVTKILNDQTFSFIPEEDTERLVSALKSFSDLKVRDGIALEKDINKYKGLHQLEEQIAKFTGTGPKSGGYLQYNPLTLPGVQQVKTLKDGTMMYKVSDSASLAKLGIGTKWCTREDFYSCMADKYINQYGHIFLFTKDGKPVMQMTPDLQQVMDVNDKHVPLPRELYGDFAEQLSKQSKVPTKIIQQFADENNANNPKFVLRTIKKYPMALQFASDAIRNDPHIVIEALKVNGDALQYASQELQDSEAFTAEASRIEGNFDYRLSYGDMDDELEQILYGGAKEFGIEPTLVRWDFEGAYDAIKSVVENRRGGYGGRDASRCAPILARAAYDSDIQRIKAGNFNEDRIKNDAYGLALQAKKHAHLPKYDKNNKYLLDTIAPYLPKAKEQVIHDLTEIGKLDRTTPQDLEDRIKIKAYENMKSEREFDSAKITDFSQLDPANQRRFIAKSIDNQSQIAQIYDMMQHNEEHFYDHYDDSGFEYHHEGEPEEDDFTTPEEFEAAHQQWEQESQDASDKYRDEEADEFRKQNFPWNFDSEIIRDLERVVTSNPIKYPAWIYKFFGKKTDHRPTVLWAIEGIQRKIAEQKALEKKRARPTKRLRRANGWYQHIKISEDEILLTESLEKRGIRVSSVNPNITIDSDLNGLERKEDGDIIRIEAYDNQRGFVIGHLNYFTQGNTLQIESIEVGDNYKRQGLATQLIEKMKQDHPGFRVEPGLVTHEGQPFFKNLKQRKII